MSLDIFSEFEPQSSAIPIRLNHHPSRFYPPSPSPPQRFFRCKSIFNKIIIAKQFTFKKIALVRAIEIDGYDYLITRLDIVFHPSLNSIKLKRSFNDRILWTVNWILMAIKLCSEVSCNRYLIEGSWCKALSELAPFILQNFSKFAVEDFSSYQSLNN